MSDAERKPGVPTGKTLLAARWIVAHIGEPFRKRDIAAVVGKSGKASRSVDDVLANFEDPVWPFLLYQDGDGVHARLYAIWKPRRREEPIAEPPEEVG